MLILGMMIGFVVAIFLVSSAVAVGEDEAYMEGYLKGLKEGEENGRCKVDQDGNRVAE